MKRRLCLLFIWIIIFNLSSCNKYSNTDKNTKSMMTNVSYKTNEQIEIGEKNNIINERKMINEKIKINYITPLNIDEHNYMVCYNSINNCIEEYNLNTGQLIEEWDFMHGHSNKLYTINMKDNIIAWSECPNADMLPINDYTHGSGWELYYANYITKNIKKVDSDNGIVLPDSYIEYGYLAPSNIDITSDYLTYISFDYDKKNEITATIKLYDIKEDKITTIDYLGEDLSNHAYGYPRISENKIVWCKALVKENGTYEGECFLYNISSGDKYKILTKENVINPYINSKYIVTEGKPNVTFYDGEICVYNIDNNTWEYKVNGNWIEYEKMNNVNLNVVALSEKYLLWNTSIPRTLSVFNFDDNKIYKIISLEENKLVKIKKMVNDVIIYGVSEYYGDINNFKWYYVRLKL